MAFHDALRQLPDALDGGDLEPPRPELQDIPLGLDDSGRGMRLGAAASGQCGEQSTHVRVHTVTSGSRRSQRITRAVPGSTRISGMRAEVSQNLTNRSRALPTGLSAHCLARESVVACRTTAAAPPYRAAASLYAPARGDAPRGPTFCRRWRSERGARSADRDRAR